VAKDLKAAALGADTGEVSMPRCIVLCIVPCSRAELKRTQHQAYWESGSGCKRGKKAFPNGQLNPFLMTIWELSQPADVVF